MDKEVYKESDHGIDENINWRINRWDSSKTQRDLEERRFGMDHGSVLGVLHNVLMDAGRVEVKQHIFIVCRLPAKFILGRPWGHSTRAVFANEDDGSYTLTIKSPYNSKEVRFLVPTMPGFLMISCSNLKLCTCRILALQNQNECLLRNFQSLFSLFPNFPKQFLHFTSFILQTHFSIAASRFKVDDVDRLVTGHQDITSPNVTVQDFPPV